MNHYQKLEAAINEVQELSLKEEKDFIAKNLIPKLQRVRDLLYFPNIDDQEFTKYMALFANDVQLDINRCANAGENTIELTELLQNIKLHIKPKLRTVEFAFSHYLKDSTQLLQETKEGKIVKLKSQPKKIYVSTSYVTD